MFSCMEPCSMAPPIHCTLCPPCALVVWMERQTDTWGVAGCASRLESRRGAARGGLDRCRSLHLSQVEKSTLREALRTLILVEDGPWVPEPSPAPHTQLHPNRRFLTETGTAFICLPSLPLGSFSVRSVEKRLAGGSKTSALRHMSFSLAPRGEKSHLTGQPNTNTYTNSVLQAVQADPRTNVQ